MSTDVFSVYGIVTADTLEQVLKRAGVKAGNQVVEAAKTEVEMTNLLKEL